MRGQRNIGRRTLIPFSVPESFESTAQVTAQGQYGEMILLGAKGHAVSDGEPMLVIATELPQVNPPAKGKSEQELKDLADFLRKELPREDVASLRPGPDPNTPPDALLPRSGGSDLRLEAAQMHLPSSGGTSTGVSRWAAFNTARQGLIGGSARLASTLRRHRGLAVYVWFLGGADGQQFTLPPRSDPTSTLVELLRGTEPGPAAQVEELPFQAVADAPEGTVAWTEDGSMGVSWGSLPRRYDSAFHRALGFELGLAHATSVKLSDLRSELVRIAVQHDTHAADVLVVTTNATLRTGLFFPSDQLVSDMLFADNDPLAGWRPSHLRGIALHDPNEGVPVRWLYGQLPD